MLTCCVGIKWASSALYFNHFIIVVYHCDRLCYFTCDAIHVKEKFMAQLNMSFKSGGMSLSFNNKELTDFIQQLQCENDIPTKQAAIHSGRQPGSLIWVFGSETQISAENVDDICLLSSSSMPYVWLGAEMLMDERSKLSVSDICPMVSLPLSTSPLRELVCHLEVCLKHNFIASICVIGAAIMAFHYTTILEMYGGCCIPVAYGPSEAGKTTAILASLSLNGASSSSHYVKGTNSFFLERSSASTLPFGIDDPNIGASGKKSKANFLDIPELIIDLYNGAKTGNSVKGSKRPLSIPIIATNFSVKGDPRLAGKVNFVCMPFTPS